MHTIKNASLLTIVASLLFLSYSCQEGVKDVGQTSEQSVMGADLFNDKCQKCHGVRRVLNTFKDEETWIKTIKRMGGKENSQISSDQLEQLVKFHILRQKKESQVFKQKCQQCHPGKRFVEKAMTLEQARAVVKKMQEKAGNTILDEDVELIINYHVREHNLAVQQGLNKSVGTALGLGSSIDPQIITLFVQKCSSCHEPERSMYVFKDEKTWNKTLKKMQAYSRGLILDEEVEQLVRFHTQTQKNSMQIFQETCTTCHNTQRIFQRSMTDEEWLHTIKEMQKKAPDLIDNEKIEVLAGYAQRFERVMAGIFEGRCGNCHMENRANVTLKFGAKDSLVVLVNERFTTTTSQPDVRELMASHTEREKREMAVFDKDCNGCHSPDQPKNKINRNIEELTLLIASIQNKVHDQSVSRTINTQIGFHKAKQRH
ncbi:MAG: cytochrome c [Proteobacteria bacterium]|nr:cytochrome c [Pseudomonadota bacterium]MBU1710432.1 cytochrome c [Pseudomonadota bacterium]